MYAVVVNVTIAPGEFASSRKALHEQVVPRVKQAPGLVKAFWTVRDDESQGTSMAVFQTKQQAETAVSMIRNSPPPAGVTLNLVELREVVADA